MTVADPRIPTDTGQGWSEPRITPVRTPPNDTGQGWSDPRVTTVRQPPADTGQGWTTHLVTGVRPPPTDTGQGWTPPLSITPIVTSLSPVEGLTTGGTTVTINGLYLNGTSTVTVDGSSVSFTQVSAIAVSFVTPAHAAGIVTVELTTAAGSDTADFTYYNPATVTGIAPSSGSTLGGTSVTVTGTGFLGATSVSFGGTNGTGLVVVDDTTITVTSPAHTAGFVDVQVTNTRETSPVNSPADQFEFRTAPTLTAMSPVEGPIAGGTTVTLTGTFLDTVVALTLGGVSNAFTYVDPTTITFVTPAHAVGTVVVAVEDTYGASASPPTQFTFYAPATVATVNPMFGSALGGTTVTITGTGFTGATAVTFGGTPGTGIVVVNDNKLRVTSPAHTVGFVDVQVTNTRETSPLNPPAAQFTFVAPPEITSITPTSGTVVGGTAVTITGSNLTGTDWVMFGTVAALDVVVVDDSTVTVTSPIAAAPGVVLVTLHTPGGTSAETITYTYTNTPPVAIAAAEPTTGDAILSVAFSAVASYDPDGAYIASYLWDFGDGSATTTGGSPTHSYSFPGTYTATLTVTDSHGATDTDTVEITVTERVGNIPPIAVASASIDTGEAPLLVRFTGDASSDPDGTIVQYLWSFGDGDFSFSRNANHIYESAGTFFATLTVVDNNNAATTSDTIVIVVDAAPALLPPIITSILPTRGSTAGGTAIRVKGLNFLRASGVRFVPLESGTVRAGTILRIIDDNNMSILSPPGTGQASIRISNALYESPVGPQCIFTYLDPPTAVASASPVFSYAPAVVEFSSSGSSSPLGPLTAYAWRFGDGSLLDFGDNDSSSERNPTHTYYYPGTYTATLTVTDRNGIVASDTVQINVLEHPGGPGGGGGGGSGGGGPGGGGGSGGGGAVDDPVIPPTQPPPYIDATCELDSTYVPRGWRYYDATNPTPELTTDDLFSVEWSARRFANGVQFTATVTVLRTVEPNLSDPNFPYPAKVFFGAISITADGNFPGPAPTGSTSNQGLILRPTIAGASGISLTAQSSAGLFTPIIGGGLTGIEEGQSFTLTGFAPAELEIAYAQIGFLSQTNRSLGGVGVAWIAVDCEIEEPLFFGGWSVSGPDMGGTSWTVDAPRRNGPRNG